MENQIIALSFGPDEETLTRSMIEAFFTDRGFTVADENSGLMSNGSQTFVCSVFEKTGYLLFKENNGTELPEPVFEYILSLRDDTTIVSLGLEDSESWEAIQTDSEYSLKRFKSLWLSEDSDSDSEEA